MGEYNPHRGIVNSAVYNHTSICTSTIGKVIASCGQDGKIALHSAIRCTDKLLQLVYHSGQEEPSSINCCLFSPRSKYIAAGSVNSTVKIWDMKANKQKQAIRKLKGHTGAVTSIGWINNEQLIASSSTSGDILLHDVLTGAIRDSLGSKLQQGINNIKVSEGQAFKRLAACTNSGSIMQAYYNVEYGMLTHPPKSQYIPMRIPKSHHSLVCLSAHSSLCSWPVAPSTPTLSSWTSKIESRYVQMQDHQDHTHLGAIDIHCFQRRRTDPRSRGHEWRTYDIRPQENAIAYHEADWS